MARMPARALIIVDLQRGFLNRHTSHIRAPIERFQHGFDHVVATRYFRRPDSMIVKLLQIDGFEPGSRDAEFAFALRADALVVDKSDYSCVTPDLARQLREWSVKETYVCGVDTDQCVLMVAGDLLQNDIVPVVCENLTASAAGPEYHAAGLFLLRRLIGREQVRRVSA
jgi:nicotinamidase-related amidase